MAVIHWNEAAFEEALGQKGVMLADFWAEWCGPCRMLGPVIEELGERYQGKALVGKVNTDEAPALAARYGVMSIPTVIFFRDGVEVERKVGVMPISAYTEVLDRL